MLNNYKKGQIDIGTIIGLFVLLMALNAITQNFELQQCKNDLNAIKTDLETSKQSYSSCLIENRKLSDNIITLKNDVEKLNTEKMHFESNITALNNTISEQKEVIDKLKDDFKNNYFNATFAFLIVGLGLNFLFSVVLTIACNFKPVEFYKKYGWLAFLLTVIGILIMWNMGWLDIVFEIMMKNKRT